MAELLKGAPVARALTEELVARCAALRERGVVPTLAIVRVGEREDDLSYERGALKRCEKVGIEARRVLLPADVSQDELLAAIEGINADPTVHGCLMFRPLFRGFICGNCFSQNLRRVSETLNIFATSLIE